MRLHRLERVQRLPVPLASVWEFFADPRNLAAITPPEMRLQFVLPLPERMHPGMLATYRLRPLPGLAVDWVTEITHVVEREMFVDEQRLGPYRYFQHQHHFRPVDGGVEMRDVVHYALPRGTDALRRWTVAPRLEQIFDYRRRTLEARFGTPA